MFLFNNALNTFNLRLYGVRHMVKRKPAATAWATLTDYQQGFFYMHHPTCRITHTMAFVTPVVGHWLEQEELMRQKTLIRVYNLILYIYIYIYIYIYQRCQLVWFTRFARAYGHTMQSLWIFMIFADSNLQSFHAFHSNYCQFAVTPAMLL